MEDREVQDSDTIRDYWYMLLTYWDIPPCKMSIEVGSRYTFGGPASEVKVYLDTSVVLRVLFHEPNEARTFYADVC